MQAASQLPLSSARGGEAKPIPQERVLRGTMQKRAVEVDFDGENEWPDAKSQREELDRMDECINRALCWSEKDTWRASMPLLISEELRGVFPPLWLAMVSSRPMWPVPRPCWRSHGGRLGG